MLGSFTRSQTLLFGAAMIAAAVEPRYRGVACPRGAAMGSDKL